MKRDLEYELTQTWWQTRVEKVERAPDSGDPEKRGHSKWLIKWVLPKYVSLYVLLIGLAHAVMARMESSMQSL